MVKKIVFIALSIFAILILTLAGIFITAFWGTKVAENGAILNDKVITIKDGIAIAFLIKTGENKAILVDSGMSEGAGPILKALSEQKLSADSVKAIFLTHGHFDHIIGCPVFKNARIFAMKEEVALIEGREKVGLIRNDGRVKTTDALKDGDKINIEDITVEAFALPGHSKGSAAYLIDGVLFMGDSAYAKDNEKMRQAIWFFSEDMDLNKASLKKLAETLRPRAGEIKVMAFAHTGDLKGVGPLLEFAEKN